MNLDYRVTMIRKCFALEDDEDGEPTLVIDIPILNAILRNFAECDWDAGADGQRDGLKNPHRNEAT